MPSLRPLRLPLFRRLALAYSVNQFGNWFGQIALAVLVYDRTRSALATAALFLAMRFLPALLGPLLTARVEILPVRRVLPALYFGEAIAYAALALLVRHFSLPGVLVLVGVDGLLAIPAMALSRGATAHALAPDRLLREGNALLNHAFTVGGVAGPALAGILSAKLGTGVALLADAGSFALAAAVLAGAHGLSLETVDRASSSLRRMGEGLRTVRSQPDLRGLLGAYALAIVFLAAVIPVEVVFTTHTLHAGASGYGDLLAAWGGGMVAGGLVFAAGRHVRLGAVLALGAAVMAAGYGGLALSPDLTIACVFSALGGVGNGGAYAASVTALQEAAPPGGQSQTMALMASVNQLMPAIGYAIGGAVTAASSPRVAYAVAAAGVAVIIAVAVARRTTTSPAASRPPEPTSAPPPEPTSAPPREPTIQPTESAL